VLLHDDAGNRGQSHLDGERKPDRAGARDEDVRCVISDAS
jgi:hypothetical protein